MKAHQNTQINTDSIRLITLHVRTVTVHSQGHPVILEDVSKVRMAREYGNTLIEYCDGVDFSRTYVLGELRMIHRDENVSILGPTQPPIHWVLGLSRG
jgi:hypothetical protein